MFDLEPLQTALGECTVNFGSFKFDNVNQGCKKALTRKRRRRRKKNLWRKDMTDVRTSIYVWTKDVTNIRCHVWCYWEQEFGEPMGTYLAHHWLVSETVVVDKKNTSVGWVFDFFVIPICADYLEEKKQNERIIGLRYLIKKIKIIEALVLGISKTSKNCWVS
jgi:hypothetical protein